MVIRRRPRPRRRLRRLLVLGGAAGGITALRGMLLARNEKRFAELIQEPGAGRAR